MRGYRDLPGSLDFVQCVDGNDTIIRIMPRWTDGRMRECMDYRSASSPSPPEIPPVPAVNFHITDDNIGEGGKTKFAEIAAIETLFKRKVNRTPLPKNRRFCRTMSVGAVWQILTGQGNWAQEYRTLKNLLSGMSAAARASTPERTLHQSHGHSLHLRAVGQMGFEQEIFWSLPWVSATSLVCCP